MHIETFERIKRFIETTRTGFILLTAAFLLKAIGYNADLYDYMIGVWCPIGAIVAQKCVNLMNQAIKDADIKE